MPYTEFACCLSGSNLNAGTLDGINEPSYSPLVSYTNSSWNSTTGVYTPAVGNPVSAGVSVGHWVSIYANGASTTGFVGYITAVTSTTFTVSLTQKIGTAPSTSATLRDAVVGGAWLGPNAASGFPFGLLLSGATNDSSGYEHTRINFKNDRTYSSTVAMTHNQVGPTLFQGYSTTFGDRGKALIRGSTTGGSYILLSVSGARNSFTDLDFGDNGATGSSVLVSWASNQTRVLRCVFHNSRGAGCSNNGLVLFIECEAYSCNAANVATSGGFVSNTASVYIRCISHDNTGSNVCGFVHTAGTYINCIADTNGLHGFIGTSTNGSIWAIGCSAYNNGGSGIVSAGSTGGSVGYMENNLLVTNGFYGISIGQQGANMTVLRNNAYYNNSSGQSTSVAYTLEENAITLTANPYVDPDFGDFRLNNVEGGGASCRQAGVGDFTQDASSYAGTDSFIDIGAVDVKAQTAIPQRALQPSTWAYIDG